MLLFLKMTLMNVEKTDPTKQGLKRLGSFTQRKAYNIHIHTHTYTYTKTKSVMKKMAKDGATIRAERLNTIAKQIASYFPRGVKYENIISAIQLNYGLTRKKAEEYIQIILDAKGWIVLDGIIKPHNGD